MVFKDIRPQAKLHYLICPKQHIKNVNTLPRTEESMHLLKRMNDVARDLLKKFSGLNVTHSEQYRIGFHRSFATS